MAGAAAEPQVKTPAWRLTSLDALRGFTMFWIIGSDSFHEAFRAISDKGVAGFFANQFKHRSWEGFVFYDLIFPAFIFIIGVSLVFSLQRIVAKEGKAAAYKRLFTRFILLFLLGVFYDEGAAKLFETDAAGHVKVTADGKLMTDENGHWLWDENELCGVLQRLALCYLLTGLLFINLKPKALIAVFAAIMIGWWALLMFVKAPDQETWSIERGKNIAHYFDKKIPPYHDTDPESFSGTPAAVCSCLLGVFAALFLQDRRYNHQQKVLILFGAGAAMTVAGYLWAALPSPINFPVIKRLWTSSYVLVAGGYTVMLLALFYQVIDIWKYVKWATPLIWIGANPLTIYMSTNILDYEALANRFVGGPIAWQFGRYSPMVTTIVALTLSILLVRFMYKRQLFLRV